MPSSHATPSTRRFRGTTVLGLLVAAVLLGGCYQNPDPTEWGAKAKTNFVRSCTSEIDAKNGTTTTVALADSATCECIYDKMVDDYSLSWEKMKDYEKAQANAKAGENPPKAPAELTKAIDDCKAAGPAAG